MEVVYSKACGVDVHKRFIVAVICDSTSGKPKYIKKRFSTFNNSLIEFRDWLKENDCENVCMESTGKYWVPVYNALEKEIPNVVVANPKWVRAIKGEKDDNKDAKWIADLFKLGIVRSSYIPKKEIRILRELVRYRAKLINIKTSEKNRYSNALTVGNCKLDIVFRHVFVKSSQSIIEILLKNETYSDEDIIKCVHKNCKATNEEILSSIEGSEFTEEQKVRIGIIDEHIKYLETQIEKIDEIIEKVVGPYEDYIELLCTIPGIKRDSAIVIISEIGTEMEQFKTHHRLASWAGLAPGNNESAGKKKSVKISKAGVYLKPCLIEVANAATKSEKDLYYKNKYEKINKRRGKKRARIAIARKILVAIYHMLSTGEVWNPRDLASSETPVEERIKYTKNNLNQTIKQLIGMGIREEELINMMKVNL